MLAQELRTYAEIILRDFTQFKVHETFQIAAGAAAQRQIDASAYSQRSEIVRTNAINMLHNGEYMRLSKSVRKLFDESNFSAVTPERLGKMFLNALPSAPTQAISSGEILADQKIFSDFQNYLNCFVGLATTLKVDSIKTNGRFIFKLQFEENIVDRKLENIALLAKRWAQVFDLLARIKFGDNDVVYCDYMSTSDFTFWLSALHDYAPALVDLYTKLLKAAKETLEVRKAFHILNQSNGVDISAKMEDMEGQIVSKFMASFFEKMKEFKETQVDEEMQTSMNVSARLLLEDIQKGVRISVEINTISPQLNSDSDAHVIENMKELRKECDDLEMQISALKEEQKLLPVSKSK